MTWLVLVWIAVIVGWMVGDRLGLWAPERPAAAPHGHRRLYAVMERVLGTRVERP